MPETREARLEYYATPGPFTRLDRHGHRLRDLPRGVPELCRVVQGLVLHVHQAFRYGVKVPADRGEEVQIRRADEMIDRILELDGADLAEARPPERRVVGNCRHFSTLLCALLRHQGVPARARCGFAAYFEPGRYVDHWVAETWDPSHGRFVLCDAQLDRVQREGIGIAFEPLDVPRDEFLVAGDAWERCRRGAADPQRFGIFDMWGRWFIAGNVVRDLASLAKRELLPWDVWGPMALDDASLQGSDLTLVERAAVIGAQLDPPLDAVRALAEDEPRLRVPRVVVANYPAPHEVDLGAGVD